MSSEEHRFLEFSEALSRSYRRRFVETKCSSCIIFRALQDYLYNISDVANFWSYCIYCFSLSYNFQSNFVQLSERKQILQNLSNVLQPKSNVEFFLTSGKRRFNAPGRGKGKKGKDGKGKDAGAGKGGGKYGTQYPQAPKGSKGYSPQIAGSPRELRSSWQN